MSSDVFVILANVSSHLHTILQKGFCHAISCLQQCSLASCIMKIVGAVKCKMYFLILYVYNN